MDQVQDFVAAGRGRRNPQNPAWFTINLTVAYALLIIEDTISSTYREVEISSKSRMWKEAMLEEMNSLRRNVRTTQEREGYWLQVGACYESRISR